MAGVGPCVGNGGGAHTGFVGKHPSGDSNAQGQKGRPYGATGECFGGEGAYENGLQSCGDSAGIVHQNPQAEQNVSHRHHRDEILCHGSNPFCTPQDHQGHQATGKETHHQVATEGRGEAQKEEGLVNTGDRCADLGGIADAKGSHHAKDAEQPPQPGPLGAQTMFDVIHWATPIPALPIRFPIANRQDHLRILHHHTQ